MEKKDWNPFGAATWIAWLGATLMAGISMVTYAFEMFETKSEAKSQYEVTQKIVDDHHEDLVKRMDRLENKVDILIQKGR